MIRKGNAILDSLDAWERLAGPKSANQWVDYRSAKECARAWLECAPPDLQIPPELSRILASHEDFAPIIQWEAEPECLVRFDEYGGPANIDVLVRAHDEYGYFVIAIEAKADEPFGPFVSRALAEALERRLVRPSSKGLDRVEELVEGILGPRRRGTPPLHRIRYQLLTASAAALAKAREIDAARAVVMVHQFQTPRTESANRATNDDDLLQFLRRLGVGDSSGIANGQLVGPVKVPGGGRFRGSAALYIGKATRVVDQRSEARDHLSGAQTG